MAFTKIDSVYKKCTLQEQIRKIEEDLLLLNSRVRGLEDLLDNPTVSESCRLAMEEELLSLKIKMEEHSKYVKELHKDNSKKLMGVTTFVFLSFLIFGCYRLITN
ncbi:uncharacterized protein LOC119668533 [Teleopsis dalmanni]|uniref:uncharacterized protein LOC119668533 n=1 Tax=Teleopsis dalmanni TaxID=139649 RepID=UPI0018CD5B4C|nr:uncharacterized protein LOC119668533 [Teleopsis dalmanni]